MARTPEGRKASNKGHQPAYRPEMLADLNFLTNKGHATAYLIVERLGAFRARSRGGMTKEGARPGVPRSDGGVGEVVPVPE
jgi:hypothetical protein